MALSNELASTSPLSSAEYNKYAREAFEKNDLNVSNGISDLLTRISSHPECKEYKFIASVTKYDRTAPGTISTFLGGLWNAQKDGSYTTTLEELGLIVTITWVHL